ncbi:hypothetical protein HUG17_0012 [Dermatophagoides farinae]|uniref:Uncharacterized protein n=1 Tax=Dermatophagoides farinae TaxID=6954 RepID=A0A9D4P541_DERFA|nr:hypothetical protein HUG17_0012 [Dermatophagoides farinae]
MIQSYMLKYNENQMVNPNWLNFWIQFQESRSTKQPNWFQIDSERRCLSIQQKLPQNNQNENNSPSSSSSAIKLIPFDHIFSGSLPEKLRSIPATLLTKPIESFANGRLNNAVIIAIDDFIDQCCPMSSPTSAGYLDINDQQKSNLINEFRQFVHRGLMMHSIAWMFDAINNRVDDECLNESNVNPKLSHCHSGINHNRAYIQLSASALFHHKIYDLIANNRSSSPSQSTLVAVDHEIEYECVNARQAANHLERALAFLEQIHLNHPNGQRNEHLFVFTIHLYRYQFVPLANSRKKCQAIENHSKLYLIDVPPSSCSSSTSQLHLIMAALFAQQNLAPFSKSKIANLFMRALSNNDHKSKNTKDQISLTILANLKPHCHRPETMLERCDLIASISTKKWLMKLNGNHHHQQQSKQSSCKLCTCKSSNASKDVDQSCASSSEQSFDTVISRDHHDQRSSSFTANCPQSINGAEVGQQIDEMDESQNGDRCRNLNGNLLEKNKYRQQQQQQQHRQRKCDYRCCNHHHHHSQSKRNPIRPKSTKNSSSSRESLRMMIKQSKRNCDESNDDCNDDQHHYHHHNHHKHHKQLAKRIRNRKRSLMNEPNGSTWSEELWVDGPNLTKLNQQQCSHSLNEKKNIVSNNGFRQLAI